VISVTPEDNLQTAFQRMRYAEISQLPVIANGHIVGLVDESDLLLRVQADPASFKEKAASVMSQDLETLRPDASLGTLQAVLERGLIAIITDETHFYGLITRFDLLNHLRKKFA